MAFVFKEKRKTLEEDKNSTWGPGEYLPWTEQKVVKVNKAPFAVSDSKLKAEINLNPGPGSYYKDDNWIKIKTRAVHAEIAQANKEEAIVIGNKSHALVDEKCENPNYIISPNREKWGFEVKEKRFKEHIDDTPGPGNYFNEKFKNKTQMRPISARTPKLQNNLVAKTTEQVPSIPVKQSNGFEIGNNNELIKLNDPDQFKMFKGEGNDRVGPGSYQIDNPNVWHKSGPSWSKMGFSRICSANPNIKSNFQNQTTNNEVISKGSTRPVTAALDMRVTSGKSWKQYNTSRVWSALRERRKMNFKTMNQANTNKESNHIYNNNWHYYEEFEKFTNKQFPGPGYYIDMNKESDFHSIPYPETRQFFGSNIERFAEPKANDYLGPATYFQNGIKDLTGTNAFKENVHVPFSTRTKRFATTKNERINWATPGPGAYEPKPIKSIEPNNFNNNVTVFNWRQKRFDEKVSNVKWQMSTPGPGSYINPYTATGTSNTVLINGLYIDWRKGKEILRPKSTNPKILKRNRDIKPDCATYDPQKLFTIAYNVKKTATLNKGEDIAFNTYNDYNWKTKKTKKKKAWRSHSDINSNIGPGYYYHDKPKEKQQIYPPFHQSDMKLQQKEPYEIGPGQYESRSYFDWNKKTYNTQFV